MAISTAVRRPKSCLGFYAVWATLILALGLASFGNIKTAVAGDSWSIVEAKGDVQVLRAGFQPVALTDGVTLHPGDRIVTTGSGRAVLTRGEDTIIVAPNSEIGLPALKRDGWGTRIIQEIGTIFLKVETAKERRFEVETPVLAAVVKGTRFTVSANPLGAAVHVLEGAVEVSAFDSQQTGLVMPGQTARLDSNPGSRLEIDGNQAPTGKKAESFERVLQTEEPDVQDTPAVSSPEIEQADAPLTPDSGGSGNQIDSPDAKVAALEIAADDPQSSNGDVQSSGSDVEGGYSDVQSGGSDVEGGYSDVQRSGSDVDGGFGGLPGNDAQQTPALEADNKGPAPRVITVSLGNTDINLRQVTRGLVRSEVVEQANDGEKGKRRGKQLLQKFRNALKARWQEGQSAVLSEDDETSGDAAVEVDDDDVAEGGVDAEPGESAGSPEVTSTAELSNGLPEETGGGQVAGLDEGAGGDMGVELDNDGGTVAVELNDDTGAPTGIGSESLPTTTAALGDLGDGGSAAPTLDDDGGAPTGLGLDDLPNTGDLTEGLGDDAGLGDDNGGAGDVATGIGDLPAGLSRLVGFLQDLSDNYGSPSGDVDDIEDAVDDIQDDLDDLDDLDDIDDDDDD